MNKRASLLVAGEASYSDLFARIHAEYLPYYRSWCHDIPILISPERDRELRRVQELLYRACAFYAAHFEEYLDRIPHDERVLSLLDYLQISPFRAGAFRPDFVVAEDGRILLCEITSRFFGNGYFMSYFMEAAGETFAKEAGVTDYRSYFEEFFAYMADMARGFRKILVLRSADRSDSIKLYVPFYRELGLDVRVAGAEEAETALAGAGDDTLVISALNQKDLLGFADSSLMRLAEMPLRNDLRSIFLLHDKRFFRLLSDPAYLRRFLAEEDAAFLLAHVIPTYLCGGDRDVWADAREHKDAYVLKHHWLGKSEQVYAGCLTPAEEWETLFAAGRAEAMILQPFIRQRQYRATWQGRELCEYLSPSILCVDDRYFGAGLFRTSSRPVINQADAHKMAPVLTDQADRFAACHVL